jgi:hypothetical protein
MRHGARLLALAVIFASQPSAASATDCGTVDPKSHVTAKAMLSVDPDSVTTVAFRRSTDPQKLLVRFRVRGCDLRGEVQRPTIDVLPKQNTTNVPEDAVSLDQTLADGTDFSLTFLADPSKFSPGSYGGFIQVRADYLVTARTPISLSRSESNELLPLMLGVLGGFVSLIWLFGLRLARGATSPRLWHYVFGLAAAAVAGVIAVDTAYRAQDVWSFGDNAGSALVAAFTGATTGAMVAALAVLFPEPDEAPPSDGDDAPPAKPGD